MWKLVLLLCALPCLWAFAPTASSPRTLTTALNSYYSPYMREENGEGIGRYSDPYTGYGSRYRLYEGRGRYGYSPYYDGGYYNDYAGAFRTLAPDMPGGKSFEGLLLVVVVARKQDCLRCPSHHQP